MFLVQVCERFSEVCKLYTRYYSLVLEFVRYLFRGGLYL